MEEFLSVGDVARLLGVTTALIRMSEKLKYIPPARRWGPRKIRIYSTEEIAQLRAWRERVERDRSMQATG